MTNAQVYEIRKKDIHTAMKLFMRRLAIIEAKALKGDYPLGEFGTALEHIVYAAGSLGANTEEFYALLKRNGIKW